MAIVKNDPFPGTDYTKYLEWEKVVTPSGQVFYVVPGHPAYVYDPIASNATGRKVFRANPKPSIEQQEEEKKNADKARKQQEFNMSPTGQLLPVVASTGGLIAAHQFLKDPPSLTDQAGAELIKAQTAKLTGTGQAAAQGAGAPATPQMVSATRVDAAVPVGTAADGGVMMSDGTVQTDVLPSGTEVLDDGSIIDASTMQVVGRVVQGAMGAYQIYQGINRFKDDKIGGALNIASGGAGVASALGYQSVTPYVAPLMIASGGYDVYNSLQNGGEGIRGSAATLGAGIGTAIAPGIGTAAGAVIGNVVGYGLDKLGIAHETTRQRAQRHTGELAEVAPDDAAYQAYLAGMREQYNAEPPDPSKPFHGGKYSTWEEYKKAGLDPTDLTGVYGNIKVFGPEWASLTEAQRVAVTKGIIDAGLYDSNKGEVEITDETKAKEIKDNVLKGFNVGAQAQAQTQGQAAAQGAAAAPPAPVVATKPVVLPPRTAGEMAAQQQVQPGTQELNPNPAPVVTAPSTLNPEIKRRYPITRNNMVNWYYG